MTRPKASLTIHAVLEDERRMVRAEWLWTLFGAAVVLTVLCYVALA
ncbi:MAG TPA: hypothetical protein VFC31_14065 [Candidatus Limnocylindria bacterium]|nr:hypothetical protein [Candidatus Limnocylindria bacterium]